MRVRQRWQLPFQQRWGLFLRQQLPPDPLLLLLLLLQWGYPHWAGRHREEEEKDEKSSPAEAPGSNPKHPAEVPWPAMWPGTATAPA
jgi:hypothetical protein